MASLALAVICKNEKQNFPQLLESVRGCFDEIHVTDTGSTDGTLDLLESYTKANPANSPLFVHHFDWVNDFAAARNASFGPVKTDYVMWLDLDDVLRGREAFTQWKQDVMAISPMWVATYHYGGLPEGASQGLCDFMRERVVKNDGRFKWRYFVHEGLMSETPVQAHYVTSWSVVHKRTKEDSEKDRSRNLKLFKGQKLDARMRYYYGKELFENNQPLEAYQQLVEAAADESLEAHDRILALQYGILSAMACNQFEKAIQLAHQGLQLSPNRAEFYVSIGDCLIKMNKLNEAIPYFSAARACKPSQNSPFCGAIFNSADAYGHYPANQLARLYFHTNRMDDARRTLQEAMNLGPHPETAALLKELERITPPEEKPISQYKKNDEIVITCLQTPVGVWDDTSLGKGGIGGSETAVIHMARELAEVTGRRVRVFNERSQIRESGNVLYQSLNDMPGYFRENLPEVVIAWRHNFKFGPAPMFVWSHDLCFQGVEQGPQYDKVLVLSEFHKRFLTHLYNVPAEKILVTRNGLIPERFAGSVEKVPGKVVFSSSPDRGLDRAIRVMDEVVKSVPFATLHVYYGFDNMLKMQKRDEVAALERMIKERPYVVFHGGLDQENLAKELQSACVWLYPTNFLETFCITAIEALSARCYPVVRKFGALADTLRAAKELGMASVIDSDCVTEGEIHEYAQATIDALRGEFWRKIEVSPEEMSWRRVAEEWVRFLPLSVK